MMRQSSSRASVVGAGVIGLTTALALRADGWDVEVLTAEAPTATTSGVAAAFWYPYLAGPAQSVDQWGRVTAKRLAELATDPVVPVMARTVHEFVREASVGPGWRTQMPDLAALDGSLPEGVNHGWSYTSWVADMPAYLQWLVDRCVDVGVELQERRLESLGYAWAPGVDLVVDCAGVEAHHLALDVTVQPVSGQVVLVRAPWISQISLDTDTPRGATYVVPRTSTVVCGGTATVGSWSRVPDDEVTADILARCTAMVPSLADAEVLDVQVGLRPTRPEVRLDLAGDADRPVLHHYGHGGAGLTLSWGAANDAAQLARSVLRR